MCLVKVREEEDVVIPYRSVTRVRTRSPSPRRRSSRRISRTEVIRESRPASSSYIAVPAPKPLAIPPPQPVPVFVQPPPSPPPPPASHISSHHSTHRSQHGGGAHYVHVSPESSVSSFDPSEVVVHEREYRRERRGRDYSPESPQRYEHFRYVEGAPPPERYERVDRRRSRSRGREYDYEPEPRGSYRETSTRIRINQGRGGRSAEYRQ
ncbi:hypothetical protein K491DRAFT_721617 [Lophiostoma macrostomum CBS 122681]|uniref:Uncharacterized protein n=1 Tax=Lophiostoma macrostomum CBS 122681 TaxID=1314788 RepID=A0A6A6SPB9_9PLEO|nr:hypothetical protein K491DRAFT_721617 [Lophiostoma macrostomum CBS 122681]